ncbi:DsbA family protein [Azorhizobium oxalatiphilum]|uniref:DsbA family protein n=1 Tax=Azorhizobium oxalatiphilum TaxID=980631 RepID=A0A917CGI3_9HYPH|nr:DsbA family protein [Azorhizobium oxalatiphilum]GGF87795.1 DsbA family protein [Azorhizobium oxalatiphilum]
MTIRLHYVHDPLCGWCYAAAPLVAAAMAQPDVELVLHGGGLFPQPMQLPAAKRAYIREADARIAQMTGQVFGPAYLDGLLPDPAFTLYSLPPIAAILAAEELRAGAGPEMLKAIQSAHYVEGRRVIEAEVLVAIASGLGLDGGAFASALPRQPVEAHLVDTRQLMTRFGLGGFPGFVRERAGEWRVVPHGVFYGQPAAFVESLRAG